MLDGYSSCMQVSVNDVGFEIEYMDAKNFSFCIHVADTLLIISSDL